MYLQVSQDINSISNFPEDEQEDEEAFTNPPPHVQESFLLNLTYVVALDLILPRTS